MKKKIILSTLLGTTTSLMALGGAHSFLYKDPRVMGMGGASIAVGGYSTAVFSNPAGLATIKKGDGFVVEILGVSAAGTKDIKDFADDINDADEADEIAEVVSQYNGQHFHLDVSNYSSVSKNSDLFAWSIGLLAATDVNLEPHTNSADGFLETSSRGYAGVVLGAAKPLHTDYGRFDIGMSVKYVMQQSYEGSLTAADIVKDSDDLLETLRDKFEHKTSGFGVDFGLTYHPFENNYWHPAFGVSLLNVGDMEMDGYYGKQAMTLNFGASVSPEVSFLDKLVIAIDYVDALNENTIRNYTYASDAEDILSYEDYEESDFMKRLRLGVGIGIYDGKYFATQLNAGMYQGAYTAGLDMTLTLFKLNVATYEEQIGTGDIDIADRRYLVQLGFGW